VFEPHPKPARAIVVVAATHDHPAQCNITTAHRHQALQSRQVLLRRCPRQVTNNLAVDLHRDGVRVIGVRGLWNQHRDDVVADPVAKSPAAQSPQPGLIRKLANHLKIVLTAEQ